MNRRDWQKLASERVDEKLGELSIEGAYLYPSVAAAVQTGGQASRVK